MLSPRSISAAPLERSDALSPTRYLVQFWVNLALADLCAPSVNYISFLVSPRLTKAVDQSLIRPLIAD
jgi:hypothetical protein